MKKETKKRIVTGIGTGIFTLSAIFGPAACKGPSGGNDPCTCTTTAHLGIGENCPCGGDGCDCTVQQYGNVNGIPVYRAAGVDTGAAATAANNARLGYDGILNATAKGNITSDKVSKIIITTGAISCESDGAGKFIIELGKDLGSNMMQTALQNMGSIHLSFVRDVSRETVRMTRAPFDVKVFARSVAFQAVGNAHEKVLFAIVVPGTEFPCGLT